MNLPREPGDGTREQPSEDGNGRIGRAAAEKAVSQGLGQPTLIALSHTINSKRKAYYAILEHSNKRNEITDWLIYFAKTVLEARACSTRSGCLTFLLAKPSSLTGFAGNSM